MSTTSWAFLVTHGGLKVSEHACITHCTLGRVLFIVHNTVSGLTSGSKVAGNERVSTLKAGDGAVIPSWHTLSAVLNGSWAIVTSHTCAPLLRMVVLCAFFAPGNAHTVLRVVGVLGTAVVDAVACVVLKHPSVFAAHTSVRDDWVPFITVSHLTRSIREQTIFFRTVVAVTLWSVELLSVDTFCALEIKVIPVVSVIALLTLWSLSENRLEVCLVAVLDSSAPVTHVDGILFVLFVLVPSDKHKLGVTAGT